MHKLMWAAVCAAAALGQAGTGEMRLEIVDPSGAMVEAKGRLEGRDGQRAFRAAGGRQSLAGLTPGRYRLELSAEGFQPYGETVEIAAGAPVSRRIELKLAYAPYILNVVGATPVAGLERPLDEIPLPVQAAAARDLNAAGALDLSAFLSSRMNNVFLNEIQGNPLQPDLNYRGYTASPLLGTPQGVSLYMDGVRLNQPFGEVVSWDLIPRVAIAEMALMPGSNPLFGLNTLGGAVSIRTKDGFTAPGTALQIGGGSFGRKTAEFEHGGSNTRGQDWFLASTMLFEDGWRETSPSNVRQFFGKVNQRVGRTSVGLSLAFANNDLIGNGLQERRLLERDYRSVYTKPDVTANRSPFLNGNFRHRFSDDVQLSGVAYFRDIRTRTLNGDINEESLDQSLYQPNANERAALTRAGFSGFPLAGENAANTPFPFWRCLGNVLLRDEPAEKCNGLLNRSRTDQKNYGVMAQVTWRRLRHEFTAGGAYDGSRMDFGQSTELGYLNPDRSVTGTGAFGDGVTGGDVDGEPFDTRVDLNGRNHSASLFATDAVRVNDRMNLTLSGRFNRTVIDNRDRLRPTAGTGSLTGRHVFQRFNPAVGSTVRLMRELSLYGNYSEGSRAPSSIELGCADPNAPCRLPNSMAGDPPLQQVVTRSVDVGVRGGSSESAFRWSAGYFQAANHDDIQFVASEQTGYGYFRGFEKTLRQGLEAEGSYRRGTLTLGGGYTLLDATFQTEEEVNGTGNSTNEDAQRGLPGVEGTIEIEPGNRIPMLPRHLLKAYADWQATSRLALSLNVMGASSSFARGNENNAHRPDGRYYLGEGSTPGFGVANAGARFDLHRRVQLSVQVNNLLDRRYYSGSQLGPTGFTATGSFIARPFPAIRGEFPVQQSAFLAPGAPRAAWASLRFRF